MALQLTFRPNNKASRPLPLNVRSVGHYQLDPHSIQRRHAGQFLQFFWCARGQGQMTLRGNTHPLKAGTVFHYPCGQPHLIKSGPKGLEYHWITFDGDNPDTIPQAFGFKRRQLAGPCPVDLFESIVPCLQNATLQGEERASLLAYEILIRAGSGKESEEPRDQDPVHQAKLWMEARFRDPHLTVTSLSTHTGLHRSTLYRLFSAHYGVSPVQYLNRLRLRHGLELLHDRSRSVADIAISCGIPDLPHFSRQIKKHTGFSPREYRLRH